MTNPVEKGAKLNVSQPQILPMSPEKFAVIKKELQAGETVIWCEQSLTHSDDVYLITDRRAIILSGYKKIEVHSFEPGDIENVSCEHNNKSSKVIFTRSCCLTIEKGITYQDVAFEGVSNPEEIKQLLMNLGDKKQMRSHKNELDNTEISETSEVRLASYKHLPLPIKNWLDNGLAPDERVLWYDKPIPRLFSTRAMTRVVLGAMGCGLVMLTAFLLNLIETNFGINSQIFFGLASGVCFILLLTPMWTYKRYYSRLYMLTNKRLLLFDQKLGKPYFSQDFDDLERTYRCEFLDGSGEVFVEWIRKTPSVKTFRHSYMMFDSVPCVRKVEALLKRLLNSPQERKVLPAAEFGLQVSITSADSALTHNNKFSLAMALKCLAWCGFLLICFGGLYGLVFTSPIYVKASFEMRRLYQAESWALVYIGLIAIASAIVLGLIHAVTKTDNRENKC